MKEIKKKEKRKADELAASSASKGLFGVPEATPRLRRVESEALKVLRVDLCLQLVAERGIVELS